ncbi:hypothetical protein DFS34DRAFT_623096 [Phlyctochytrium arcticum]|nr:hypothetical protein DFS34DRAFT_623096 [Phlyctochytrium arcticum]
MLTASTFSCRAFANPQNPLKNCQTLECDHLNTFVHPIFRETCHYFANQTTWQAGEISNTFFLERTKADGVAVLRDRDNLPLAYFEGSRPKPLKKKHSEDEFVGSRGWSWEYRWRNYGIVAGFWVFNVVLVAALVGMYRSGR